MSRANPRYRRTNPQLPILGTNVNVFLITVGSTADNQQLINNFAYKQTAAGLVPNGAENALINSWWAANGTNFLACISNDTAVTFVKATCLTLPARIPFVNTTLTGTLLGTFGFAHVNLELATVFTKYTSTKGQHGRGRNYMPAVPTQAVGTSTGTTNNLNSAGITAYSNFIAHLSSTSISDGSNPYALGIYTRVKAPAAVTNADFVASVLLRTLLGTARRRRIGRGK